MGNRKNEIIINGKRYDARTGKLLDNDSEQQSNNKPRPTTGTVMDGFVKTKTAKGRPHSTPTGRIHAAQERSKTLMRTAVKKPMSSKIHSKATPAASNTAANNDAVSSSKIATPAYKETRAAKAHKSPLISRFGFGLTDVKRVAAQTAVLAVRPEPTPKEPILKHSPPKPFRTNPFDTAVEHATSHQQKVPKKLKARHKIARKLRISPKIAGTGSFAIALIIIGGFVAYQNVPNIAMQLASTRSGVRAQLPAYKPAGFKINGRIQYSPGQVTVTYSSVSDERGFYVTQRKSSWNSDALLENFIVSNQRQFQTYQDKGKTIYIYGDSNATWIDSGVWYQIEGNSSLSSDQLLKIANSL